MAGLYPAPVTKTGTDYDHLKLEELNYNSYLMVPELLDLQNIQSEPEHPDELFFILIHQSFELWFKLCLHETDRMIHHLQADSVSRALKVLKRINAVFEVLGQKVQLLSTLTPAEFAGFRERLGTGSGFQSVQFREIEFLYGLKDEWFLQFFKEDEFAAERLQKRLQNPSVYQEVLASLERSGFEVPEPGNPGEAPNAELVKVFHDLYADAEDHYHWVLLFEALIDFDTAFAKWRSIHVLMVSRTIGGQSGTGGSSGKAFLESRIPHRFFPELWEVRNSFHKGEHYGQA